MHFQLANYKPTMCNSTEHRCSRTITWTLVYGVVISLLQCSLLTAQPALAEDTLGIDEELKYRDGTVLVTLTNSEGMPEGYFTSDQFPEV